MSGPHASGFAAAEEIILQDPGGRKVAALHRPGELEAACRALMTAKRVGIVTGFYIPSAGACETDGPLGAAHLATALRGAAEVVVCTDRWCLPVVKALVPDATDNSQSLASCDVLLAVERLGRAADGRYYSMRGVDLTPCTEPLDAFFLNRAEGVVTIGVGDGGNEIGMGRVQDAVRRSIAKGETIACVVPTDHLVVAGVSNWGAWALAAAVEVMQGRTVLPDNDQALADLEALVAAGAVDGVTGRNEATVDGLAWDVHVQKYMELRLLDLLPKGL